jgi:hypothetical protein
MEPGRMRDLCKRQKKRRRNKKKKGEEHEVPI